LRCGTKAKKHTKLGDQIPLGFQRLVGFVATQRWRTDDTNLKQPISTKTTSQRERERERETEESSYGGEKLFSSSSSWGAFPLSPPSPGVGAF